MADKKISELPKINAISGSTVILPIVHDGTTQKMDVSTFSVYTSQWSATTASNTFIGNQTVNGNLVITGKLTAQELFTEITSASIIFESGSTIFGNTADDTHIFTGTININGNVVGNAPLDFTSQSLNIATGSYNRLYDVTSSVHFTTASLNTQTGSQDLVNLRISSTTGSINTTTSSFDSVFLGISSVTGAINTTTSSFDSVFLGISSFTGSLNSLTGSYATTGSNTFRGNQIITGSLSISHGEFNVTTGSLAVTSSLRFDHTQNDGATLQLSHDNNTAFADHAFNVTVKSAGVYTQFVQNGTPYSILNVEAFDNNNIYVYRDTRLYNKSLFIDNNLTVQEDVVIGTGSLNINNGRFSVTSGSGELTSSLAFTHNTISPTQGYSLFTLRHINNDFNENFALKLFADDYIAKIQYEQNNVTYDILRTNLAGDVHLTQNTRVFGMGLTVDDSLLVKGVITGSLLATNGVVSSSNQLFELNAFTGSVIGQTNTISTFTASVNFTTQSLNTQTGSQDLVNRGISSVTGSINTTTSSFNSVFSQIGSTTSSLIGITNGLMAFTAALDSTYATDAQLYQLYQATASVHFTTQSLNTQTGSQDLVNRGISSVTGSINTTTSSFNNVFLGISSVTGAMNTQSSSQDLVNLGISSVTGSLIGITNGLMAFTAALDTTYATDAQLYQLYQATASIHFTTQSLNTQTGSQDSVNLGISTYTGSQNVINSSVNSHILVQSIQTASQDLVNLGISTFTGSLRSEVNGIESYTASLKGAIEVSGQNVNVLGMITAQQFNVTLVSSSVMYQSGSTKFGDSSDDRHQFTGSLHVTGSSTFNSTAAKVMEVQSGTSTGGYVRFTYNGSSNSIGYIGNSNQLSGVGTVSDLELRADTNLTLTAGAAISTSTPSGSVYQVRSTNGASGDHIFKSFNTQILKLDGGTNTATFADNIIMASGKGIDFSATSNGSGTTTSELLNDYEEGTWTGTLKGGVSDPTTPVTATGYYTKVGNKVFATIAINNATTTGASGNVTIIGLPFTSAATNNAHGSAMCTFYDFNGGTSLVALMGASTTTVSLMTTGDDADWNDILHTAGTGKSLRFSITYFV